MFEIGLIKISKLDKIGNKERVGFRVLSCNFMDENDLLITKWTHSEGESENSGDA